MNYALVVTLYKGYNYGSALQCFALQQVIRKHGIKPYVIEFNNRGLVRHIIRIVNNVQFYVSCYQYSGRRESFQGIVKNAKEVDNGLTEDTKVKFGTFIEKRIVEISRSYEELVRLAKSEECVACISGSDQVWGTSVKYLNPIHFLTFAPKTKRYSYAASFGSSTIPEWFVNDIKRYLRSYRRISVREDNALKILDDIGIKNGEVMVDPTLLLTAEEWTQIEKRPEGIKDDFELMHFLNTPSSIAENHIGRMRERHQKGSSGKVEVPKAKHQVTENSYVVSSIITSSMLTTYYTLKEIGFWNEDLFLDMADWDLCWRIQRSGKESCLTNVITLHHTLGLGRKKVDPISLKVTNPIREYYQIRDCLYLKREDYVPLCVLASLWNGRNMRDLSVFSV